MSFFNDWRSHYTAGFLYGVSLRIVSRSAAEQKIIELDLWAWNREVEQHDPELTPHQIEEAMAWGRGARRGLGLSLPFPVPPYPLHA